MRWTRTRPWAVWKAGSFEIKACDLGTAIGWEFWDIFKIGDHVRNSEIIRRGNGTVWCFGAAGGVGSWVDGIP